MSPADWMVLAGGTALIAWIIWYFLFSEPHVATVVASPSGIVEVPIIVRAGYQPSLVRLRAGDRVRLVFDRQETAGCSEEVVFPEFGIRRFLPPYEKTAIELTPAEPGRFEFTCGMSMLHGALIVEPRQ